MPVKVERSGVRSVLFGAGAGRAPELRFMAPTADIQVGDVLVTSGLDGTYPPGLAVARSRPLERDTGQMFARITARPLAGVDRSGHLLVLGRGRGAAAAAGGAGRGRGREEGAAAASAEAAVMALPSVPPLLPARPGGNPAAGRGRGSSC